MGYVNSYGKRGRFITLEGIDGAGKTTQLAVVRHCLEDRVSLSSPHGSPVDLPSASASAPCCSTLPERE